MYKFSLFSLLLILVVSTVFQFTLPSRENTRRDLKDPDHVDFESGVRRLRDGKVEVASFVIMPGVTSNMFRWWFSDYLKTTEHYKKWHPEDHIWMDWEHKKPGEIKGRIIWCTNTLAVT